jgi:hypothetical protein
MNARGLGRLGMLAVGLGIGAAVAAVGCPPGIASADTSTDWLSSIDGLLTGGSPAASSPLDYQISFNGQDLFPTMGNEATATTVAGQYGLAIAYGDGAKAIAEGGTGDYALASGTNAFAGAGSLTGTGNNYDTAVDIGNNADPDTLTGPPDGAYAGGGSLIVGNLDSGTNSHDTAIDIGNNGTGNEFPSGGQSGAFAGDSNLLSLTGGAGNGDTAYTFGNINGFNDGSFAGGGNNDYASMSGSETGNGDITLAAFGDNNSAIANTNYTADDGGVHADFGNGNYAYVYGPDNSTASAGGEGLANGNHDLSYVLDPFSGTTGPADSAISGSLVNASGSNDLAAVLLTHGDAAAQGANDVYDIISLFGNETGTAAATSGSSFLTELLGLL